MGINPDEAAQQEWDRFYEDCEREDRDRHRAAGSDTTFRLLDAFGRPAATGPRLPKGTVIGFAGTDCLYEVAVDPPRRPR